MGGEGPAGHRSSASSFPRNSSVHSTVKDGIKHPPVTIITIIVANTQAGLPMPQACPKTLHTATQFSFLLFQLV